MLTFRLHTAPLFGEMHGCMGGSVRSPVFLTARPSRPDWADSAAPVGGGTDADDDKAVEPTDRKTDLAMTVPEGRNVAE